MENLWPEINDDDELYSPADIIENQAAYIKSLTDDLLEAKVEIVPKTSKYLKSIAEDEIPTSFSYYFRIGSKYIDNYKRNLFMIFYDIKFYPLYLFTDIEIDGEIDIEMYGDYYMVNNEEEFISLLRILLNSDDVKLTLKNLKALAKKEYEIFENFEF